MATDKNFVVQNGVRVGTTDVIDSSGNWIGPGTNITGDAGFQGSVGRQGSAGAQGPQGSAGPQGFQGNIGATGTTGSTGSTGVTGVVGAQGPQGPQGPQGVQGTTGVTGIIGSQGSVGVTGTSGAQGPQGVRGPQGPQGNQGTSGVQGAQGSAGAQGVTGAQGPQGNRGPQGPQGSQGATGSQGVQGATGVTGTTGATGVQGAVGATGATGAQGSTGGTGTTGIAGVTGSTGSQGAQGPQGPQGVQGAQGSTGGTGPTGIAGATGPTGATGAQGAIGSTGATGVQGSTGGTGVTGIAGVTGATGRQGAQGPQGSTGVQGVQGSTGATGTTGIAGVTGTTGATGRQGATGPIGATGVQGAIGSTLNTWYDLSGNSNNGTLFNGVAYDAGIVDTMTFDGINDYVQSPLTGSFPQITFEFWGYFDDPSLSTTSRNESAFGDWISGRVHFGTRWSVGMHWNVNSVWEVTPPTNLVYGWNHYCLVWNNNTNQKLVYINNILSSSYGTNGNMTLGDFKIGVATNLNQYYRGKISNFKIYNRALSATEIQQNYDSEKNRFSLVSDGLILYLDAARTSSYPGTGTTWTDLTGNGNTGTLTNGPTYDSAYGGSLVFDGIDDYIQLPTALLSSASELTMCAWVNPVSLIGGNIWAEGGTSGSPLYWQFTVNTSNWYTRDVSTGDQGARNNDIATGSLVANSWNHVTAVYSVSGGYKRYYVNTTLRSSTTTSVDQLTSTRIPFNSFIGRPTDPGDANDNFFSGQIAKVMLYNRALSAQEVQNNFNAQRGRYGI